VSLFGFVTDQSMSYLFGTSKQETPAPKGAVVQEEKTTDEPVVIFPLLRAPHPAARGVRANKPIKAFLSYYQGTSGAANTAFATSFLVQPNLDSSWASWQATFDEVKVLSAEIHWNVYNTVVPTVIPANSPNAIVVYEPGTPFSLASVNAGMQYERFSLLRVSIPFGITSTAPLVAPISVNKAGYLSFKAKIPNGPMVSTFDTTASAGMWRPTADGTNYHWGSFQGYVSQGGTSAVLRQEGFVRMEVEFRCRR